MLPSKTSIRGQALVNIANIRRSFENNARKLFVVITAVASPSTMEKITMVTRSGRRATAILNVNKSMDKPNPKNLPIIKKDHKGTVTSGLASRKQVKTTRGMEKGQQMLVQEPNVRVLTSSITESSKNNAIRLDDKLSNNLSIKSTEQNHNSEANLEQSNNTKSTRLREYDKTKIKDIIDINIKTSNTNQIAELSKSTKKRGRPKKVILNKDDIQDTTSNIPLQNILSKNNMLEVNISLARRSSPRKNTQSKLEEPTNTSTVHQKCNTQNKELRVEENNYIKTVEQKPLIIKKIPTTKFYNRSIINSSITENKRTSPRNSARNKKNIVEDQNDININRENQSIVATNISLHDNKGSNEIEEAEQNNFVTQRNTRRNKQLPSKNIHGNTVKFKVHTKSENRNLAKELPNKSALDISQRRLRKPNLKYFNESIFLEQGNLKVDSNKEQAKRLPIYQKGNSDSDSDKVKKKDIYKFTVDDLEKSDANPYDKDTDKIMHLIEKAEKNKAKRKLKAENNTTKRRKNYTKVKNQLVETEINSANDLSNNLRTYQSSSALKNQEAQKRNLKVQILTEVVVHAPSSGNKINLTTEIVPNNSISAFDKLKATHLPNSDRLVIQNQFNSPGPSVYTCNSTPYPQIAENTPIHKPSDTIQHVHYTSHIEPTYDLSNNFGFDDDGAVNSPEHSILIQLNEVSRKLQNRTPWRNLLIVKNKRVLTVKGSSLPNVDQDLILDSTIVEKLCRTTEKAREKTIKSPVQTKLNVYLGRNATDSENAANLSTLFDASNLSPIKQANTLFKSPQIKSNVIYTPRKSFRRNIMSSTNMQSTPNVVNLLVGLEKRNSNKSNTPDTSDLDNSYFGFITPNNKKSSSKENVTALVEKKSPSKLPMRIIPADLRRFRKKYVSKKQRAEELRKMEGKKRLVDKTVASSIEDFEDENDVSDELPNLGLFDELLREPEPEEDHIRRKRCRKENNETDRIRGTKRRNKNEKSEFDRWAEKFNKMCQQVESHKLLIE